MQYLILADIHANLEALQAVLSHASQNYNFSRVLVLGDLIGYCANPNEVIELIKQQKEPIILMGNHDAAVVGKTKLELFNPAAAECIRWTKKQLKEENLRFLEELPYFFSTPFVFACHASPRNFLWEYLDVFSALQCLDLIPETLLLFGHNHECFYASKDEKQVIASNFELKINKKTAVSIPAVGQPRDKNPQAGYAVLDFNKKMLYVERVGYDIEKAAKKIIKAGLPTIEAERLFRGE